MRRKSTISVVGLALTICLLTAAGASARCPAKNSALPGKDTAIVVKKTSDAVVVRGKKKGRLYGCAYKYGKLRWLNSGSGYPPTSAPFSQLQLAGKFVALVADSSDGVETGTRLSLFSLASRKTVQYSWNFPDPSALVLSKAGSAAWILTDYTYADGFKEHIGTSVFSLGSNWKRKPRILDDAAGAIIAPSPLRLDGAGGTVFWLRNGVETSAPVTGGQATTVFGGGCFVEGSGSRPGQNC